MRALLFLTLLCSGCFTSGHGMTNIWQQRAGRLNTTQVCLSDPALLPLADLALVLLAREAIAVGIPYDLVAKAAKEHPIGVCLVPAPEKCCNGSICRVDIDKVVREKAGCTVETSLWVSKTWTTPDYDYTGTLITEVSHALANALGVPQSPDYSDRWSKTVLPRATAAFLAALKKQ